MRSGLFLPLFDALADPEVVARLSAEAEEAGWHGVFVWDNLRFQAPVVDVADPWITLAAMATATKRIRLGPMVTPLARRRPVKVARETATLDRLSGGRLTLGVGLGSDRFAGEYSITGEELDDRRRASMLDESLEILAAAWSGEAVHHRGEHYTVDGMRFLPRPVQRPGVPVWVAGYYGKPRPVRRAARHQGFFPLALDHPEQVAEIVADLAALRSEAGRDPTEPYAVIGSIIGTAYSRDMSGAPHAAGESIGATHAVAGQVGGATGRELADTAGHAFTEALGIGLTAAAVVALAGALLVLLRLPSGRRPATTPGLVRPRPSINTQPSAP